MNLIFTCGGTAGHINPAIAVANILKERHPDVNILFIGASGHMEEKLVPQAGYELACLPGSGLSRSISFSGLKTAVLNVINQCAMKGEELRVADLAASFQFRITDILAEKLLLAARDTGAKTLCVAGGVAANALLRENLTKQCKKQGIALYLPELAFCGDNAAMIAAQGYYELLDGNTAGLDLNSLPTLPIDYRE